MKLGEIANIKTGLVLSRKAAISDRGVEEYKVITFKSLKSEGYLDENEFEDFYSSEGLNDSYITKEGDVVIRLSTPNTAAYIGKELEGAVVSSNFCVIRLIGDSIAPEYLAWYLNSSFVKKQINKELIGSAVPVVKVSFLSELSIEDIPKEKQRKITEINNLYIKEKQLLSTLIREKEIFYKKIMTELVLKD